MPFRVPILPSMGDKWYTGFSRDARQLGLRFGSGFIIPKDERAISHNFPVTIAESRDAVDHVKNCLRMAGFRFQVYDKVSEHTAKRTGAAVIRLYNGPHKMDTEEYSNWLHHRPSGPFQAAGPYNKFSLKVPCEKAAVILEEWLQTASAQEYLREEPWRWSRLKFALGNSPLRYHVMVLPETRASIFEFLRIGKGKKPVGISDGEQILVSLCHFLSEEGYGGPSPKNFLLFDNPSETSSFCDVCMSRAKKGLWC